MNDEYDQGLPPLRLEEDLKRSKIAEKVWRNLITSIVQVAFLNLCNGEVKNLDRWHWTTIVALEYSEDFGKVYIDIVDGGQIHNVDFALWYKTTKLGGGLVRITMPDIASTESNLKMTVGL